MDIDKDRARSAAKGMDTSHPVSLEGGRKGGREEGREGGREGRREE